MSVRLLCPLLAVALGLAVAPAARADDELDKFIEMNRVLAQKVKDQAKQAMAHARTLEKSDPEQAQAVLQAALKQVQNSTALPAGEQSQLTAQILGRLREVGEIIRQQNVVQKQAPLKELPKKAVGEPPATVPGPGAVAQKFIEQGKAGAAAAGNLQAEKNKGFSGAVAAIESSAVPTQGDVTYPKDWQARTEMRKKLTGVQLTPKEVALVKALNSLMTVDIENKSLKDTLEYLQDRTGQMIIVDPGSLKEANVDYGDPVNFPKVKVTFRTVLRKVLGDLGLTYVIKEGAIQVMTPARAREMMVVRTYPIDDLVAPGLFAQQYGPFIARAQMLANVQNLINAIQGQVDPGLWQPNGGGSISFFEPGMALVIRAPAEFHYQMAGGGLLNPR
jgi:hypothetical protein